MTSSPVAVLFARHDSVYKSLPECDVWDEARDARRWPGGCPVIAHPPCRTWAGLRHLAKAPPGEHELAEFALAMVRQWGGVLEHPSRSQLWPQFRLPLGDQVDEHGGYSLLVNQCWWGHLAEKSSLLYVCGVRPEDVPALTVHLRAPRHTVGNSGVRLDGGRLRWRPDLSKRQREATPTELARWLVQLAGRVRPARHGRADLHGSRSPGTAAQRATAAVPAAAGGYGSHAHLGDERAPCAPRAATAG